MRAIAGLLEGTIVFEPTPHRDERGFFTRTFDQTVARAAGLDPASLVQDSQSRSGYGVVRGLHLRTDGGEGKLVRCAHGAIIDVAVDLRPWSPTFRQWMTVLLDDAQHRSVWLPPGLAHGFQALTRTADTCYRIDREHAPGFDATIRYDDPVLNIPWPIEVRGMSDRDLDAPGIDDLEPSFDQWFGALR